MTIAPRPLCSLLTACMRLQESLSPSRESSGSLSPSKRLVWPLNSNPSACFFCSKGKGLHPEIQRIEELRFHGISLTNSNWKFGPIWTCTEESQFFDSVDFGGEGLNLSTPELGVWVLTEWRKCDCIFLFFESTKALENWHDSGRTKTRLPRNLCVGVCRYACVNV